MRTADDDSAPVPHETFSLPRAVLTWKTPPRVNVWRPPRDRDVEYDEAFGIAREQDEDTPITNLDSLAGVSLSVPGVAFDDDPTIAIQMPIVPQGPEHAAAPQVPQARATAWLGAALAPAARLWRDGPLRTAAIVAAAVSITYLAVGGARRGSDNHTRTMLAPPAARPAAAPIIIEQLSGALQSPERAEAALRAEGSDKASKRSASSRALGTSLATMPASKSDADSLPAPAAPSKPQASRTERSSTAESSKALALPAWGADAVRDFSRGKSSAGASATSHAQALPGKAASSADSAPPTAASPASPREQPVAAPEQDQTAPVVAVKPAEPPTPAAPPAPSKPLSMDQLLSRVDEAAQAQRKEAGLKAPKARKRDAELDELITGAIQSKK